MFMYMNLYIDTPLAPLTHLLLETGLGSRDEEQEEQG